MSAHITKHAEAQIIDRGVTTTAEVLTAVNAKLSQIRASRTWEVRVIVKRLRVQVFLPDGSNGDVILACVDPVTLNVKTVMLQRSAQVERKAKSGESSYL
jgi:hypothetical protein